MRFLTIASVALLSCGVTWVNQNPGAYPGAAAIVLIDFDTDNDTQTDQSGNGHDAVCSAGVACPTHSSSGGPRGSGYYSWVDANSDNAFDIADHDDIDFDDTEEFTVSFHARPENDFTPWGDATSVTIEKAGAYSFTNDSSGSPSVHRMNTPGLTGSNPAETWIADNEWHHYAMVYDGSDQYIYIDGVKGTSQEVTEGTPTNTATDLSIGVYDSFNVRDFAGSIDNFRVYDYAQSAVEVAWDRDNDI